MAQVILGDRSIRAQGVTYGPGIVDIEDTDVANKVQALADKLNGTAYASSPGAPVGAGEDLGDSGTEPNDSDEDSAPATSRRKGKSADSES